MKIKSFGASSRFSLAIMITMLIIALLPVTATAKPVGKNPGTSWPSGTFWGTNLRLENDIYVGQAWFGTRASQLKVGAAPDPPDGLIVEFYDGSKWAIWVEVPAANENWPVRLRTVGAGSSGGTLRSTMENADTSFVPQDYSVVLENTALSLRVNLRKENKLITSLPLLATLYADNAVNIQSIDNLDPLTGVPGDNLRLRVFVKNTGRYTDNYAVSAGGSLDPTILNLAPGNTDNVILTTTLPNGTENIVVTAAGNYATDQDYVTATGLLVRNVDVEITPFENFGENGDILTFDVRVKNIGDFPDSYQLTIENIWETFLSSTQLDNLNPGENTQVMLSVKIPDNANQGDSDNITVTATSIENAEISDNATCIARMGSYSVEVSITPGYLDNAPGGTLDYTVKVSNTGTLNDNYNLTFSDNIDGSAYWEDNISLDNLSLMVPAGETRTTILRVTIPDDAIPGTNDNITVTATSQANNTVSASSSCIADVARLLITISPENQSGLPGVTLIYMVVIQNEENVDGAYYSVVTDSLGWNLAFGLKNVTLYPYGEVWTIIKVTIPENAIGGTDDNVTVTMVSMDNTYSYSATCVAHVVVVHGVEVSITPGENKGPPGATLEYIVTVNNTGNIEDNYVLTAIDNSGWSLMFLPPSVIVQPKSSENVVFNVTIPENASPLTLDNITVTATSQDNENVIGENSCTALSLAVFKLHLLAGWNLVGFSLTTDGTTPGSVFPGLTYFTDYYMYYYVAPFGPYVLMGPDDNILDNTGYWIWVKNENTIMTAGIPPENRDIHMAAGWSIVHFPIVDNTTTPNKIFTGMTYYTDYYLYWYLAPFGPYELLGPNDVLQENLGYWVWVVTDKTVTCP